MWLESMSGGGILNIKFSDSVGVQGAYFPLYTDANDNRKAEAYE